MGGLAACAGGAGIGALAFLALRGLLALGAFFSYQSYFSWLTINSWLSITSGLSSKTFNAFQSFFPIGTWTTISPLYTKHPSATRIANLSLKAR